MNSVAIDLSNQGVAELQCGNIVQSFQLLTKAARIVVEGLHNHSHVDALKSTFRFHWEDCAEAGVTTSSPTTLLAQGHTTPWEGSVPFLYLRALRITYSGQTADVDELCACGYAWAIWFNLALCSCIIGSRLGEKGKRLLEVSFEMYTKVQRRIESEPSSKHWDLLQMAVLNNLACIYRDAGKQDNMHRCLNELGRVVLLGSPTVEDSLKTSFRLSLQILGNSVVAPCA